MMLAVAARSPIALAHVAAGAERTVLQRIQDGNINLALWTRVLGQQLEEAVAAMDLSRLEEIRIIARPDEAANEIGAASAGLIDGSGLPSLAADVGTLAGYFSRIARQDEVEIRLERVVTNGCYKFHSDYVPVRLITTYLGRGTEWLSGDQTAALAAGASPDATVPQRLSAGHVGLFKGRKATDRPIVHRSPPIAGTGEERLLLVINGVSKMDLIHV